MAEEQSTFASEAVELSELERITSRLNSFTVGLKPANAEQVNQIMQKGLSAGNFKLDELDALVSIREQINAGIIDYNTQVQVATKRIQELEQEELQKQRDLVIRDLATKDEYIAAERQTRKTAERALSASEEENRILKAQLEALTGVAGNVTSKPVIEDEGWDANGSPVVSTTKPKSKAWDMVRQARPTETEEEPFVPLDLPQSETTLGVSHPDREPFSTDEDFIEKIEDTKKAFKEFEEESASISYSPKGDSVESFYDEVERVNEVADADALTFDELFSNETESVGFDDESFDEDADFVDDEMFYNGVSPEKALEDVNEKFEDTLESLEDSKPVPSTGQVTSKPIITGGNAPNIQAQVNEPENITAPVEEEKKTIPTFDTEEELLASAQAKIDEAEEEYEEITIPSRSELEGLSKSEVAEEGDKLGFELSGSKTNMIDQFEQQTEAFIASLQEDGDFISASDTDSEEEKKDGDDDVRDGGYF